MKKSNVEQVDLTKTLIFILLTLIMTIIVAGFMIIPNIQNLKISKIYTERTFKELKRKEAYYQQLVEKHEALKDRNRKIIAALEHPYKEDELNRFGMDQLGVFRTYHMHTKQEASLFDRHELNVTTALKSPKEFYGFIDALENYNGLAVIDFPFVIKANDDYSLTLQFMLGVYEQEDPKESQSTFSSSNVKR